MDDVIESAVPRVARRPWWRRLWRVLERGVLSLVFVFYLLLHLAGVVEAERAMAVIGMLGMAIAALALWLVGHR